MLKNGRRYQGTPGQADFQSMEFERYSMRVASQAPVWAPTCRSTPLPTQRSCWPADQPVTRAELL